MKWSQDVPLPDGHLVNTPDHLSCPERAKGKDFDGAQKYTLLLKGNEYLAGESDIRSRFSINSPCCPLSGVRFPVKEKKKRIMKMDELLDVQTLAANVVEEVYKVTWSFPASEERGLVSQMRKSAVSIVSNIAEGRARESKKEYIRFLNYAYASGKELEAQARIATMTKLLQDDHQILLRLIDRVLAMLWKLQDSLKLP